MTLDNFTRDPRHSDIQVKGLCCDSRVLRADEVFFAIRGHSSDGHIYLDEVVLKDPAALVVESKTDVPRYFTGPVIVVPNSRAALDQWSAQFYDYPAKKLFCIGVTGTNGKTTSCYMLERIFNLNGWPTGVLGTIDHHFGRRVWETSLTTPDPITLHSRLRDFLNLGAKAAAFEVSSIAIEQNRATSIPFDAALFTNFSRDHLDYHNSMEQYFLAKQRLFSELLSSSMKKNPFAVLNADDPMIAKIKPSKARYVWFGQDTGDYSFRITSQSMSESRFEVNGQDFSIATPGLHNVYNAVGALAIGHEAGIPWSNMQKALSQFTGAPGRLENVENSRGLHVFVDYAHTDEALHSVLASLRNLMKHAKAKGKLWTVFGCGGDRDRGKRPLMAKVANENSDHVVLTSDNPRTEDPEEIVKDCLKGIPKGAVHVEVDRKKAIAYALQTAKEGDVILIAGKGHENYQILGQEKVLFSDVKVVREFLN